jgi:hypothetical protein
MIKDEILVRLRNGVAVSELRKEFRSMSAFAEALRVYMDELEENTETCRMSLEKTTEELNIAHAELDKAKEATDAAKAEYAQLEDANKKLVNDVDRAKEGLESLHSSVEELEARGFTCELVKELGAIEARSSMDVLRRVETAAEYSQLRSEVSKMKKEEKMLKSTSKKLQMDVEKIRENAASEKNTLDDLRLKACSYGESVDVVGNLLKIGFSFSDLKGLAQGLEFFGIKGNPARSVSRLVEGLVGVKTLFTLEEKIKKRTKDLQRVERAVADLKSEAAVMKDVTVKSLQEVKDASVYAVKSMAQQTDMEMNAGVEHLIQQCNLAICKIEELERRKTEVVAFLESAVPLVDVMQTASLKSVPPQTVVEILSRIQLWCATCLPYYKVTPTQEFAAREFNFCVFSAYSLSGLIGLALLGLKKHLADQQSQSIALGSR